MGCRLVQLQDICTRICSGGTPRSKENKYYDGGTIPWLNTREVNFKKIEKTEKCITQEGLEQSSAKWINKNAVIIAMYGATAGKSAITSIPLTTNQACCNLEIDSRQADYRYVYYWLMVHYEKIAGMANGAAQQNLNVKEIRELDIFLPDLYIQRRVSDFLSSFDEKIELNNRANDYLTEHVSFSVKHVLPRYHS